MQMSTAGTTTFGSTDEPIHINEVIQQRRPSDMTMMVMVMVLACPGGTMGVAFCGE